MAASPNPPRRLVTTLILASLLLSITFVTIFRNQAQGTRHTSYASQHSSSFSASTTSFTSPGRPIAPKLGNETLKAELGRAAWKLFHTTFASFPDTPTAEESHALLTYIHLFQRLYPCGECAEHFGNILEQYPPQVSGRSAAAAWGCHVHNEVNKSLKKDVFDCANIGDFYDCGCADDAEGGKEKRSVEGLSGGRRVVGVLRVGEGEAPVILDEEKAWKSVERRSSGGHLVGALRVGADEPPVVLEMSDSHSEKARRSFEERRNIRHPVGVLKVGQDEPPMVLEDAGQVVQNKVRRTIQDKSNVKHPVGVLRVDQDDPAVVLEA